MEFKYYLTEWAIVVILEAILVPQYVEVALNPKAQAEFTLSIAVIGLIVVGITYVIIDVVNSPID